MSFKLKYLQQIMGTINITEREVETSKFGFRAENRSSACDTPLLKSGMHHSVGAQAGNLEAKATSQF